MAWHDPRRLTGMSAPLAIWALHLVALYGLQGLACASAWHRHSLAGQPLVFWAWLVLTLLALAAIGWLGLRAWRCRRDTAGAAAGVGLRLARFGCRLTLLVAAIALVAVVFTVVPVFMLAPCE